MFRNLCRRSVMLAVFGCAAGGSVEHGGPGPGTLRDGDHRRVPARLIFSGSMGGGKLTFKGNTYDFKVGGSASAASVHRTHRLWRSLQTGTSSGVPGYLRTGSCRVLCHQPGGGPPLAAESERRGDAPADQPARPRPDRRRERHPHFHGSVAWAVSLVGGAGSGTRAWTEMTRAACFFNSLLTCLKPSDTKGVENEGIRVSVGVFQNEEAKFGCFGFDGDGGLLGRMSGLHADRQGACLGQDPADNDQ